ncbi:hypothetical protein B0T09DRAFT_397105 [Sordaria sp. MPI-SDFR-AT-0083]|nr:hypothetical protein B0T09DRAFT_397105 [Sordaria sp. MPI-SDFR-AT-0083]
MKFSGPPLFGAVSIALAHGNGHLNVNESHDYAHIHKACGIEGIEEDYTLRLPAANVLLNGDIDVLNHYAGNNTRSRPQDDLNPPSGHNWSISCITNAQRGAYLSSLPPFTSPSTTTNKPNPAKYTISSIPGKGLGLIATTRIPRGSVILSSHPTLMIDYRVFDELLRTDYMSLQAAAISSLPSAHRSAFFHLYTQSKNDTAGGRLSRIAQTDSIITTNAFDISASPRSPFNPAPPEPKQADDDDDDDTWYTVFASPISRLNHDCRPNADYRFDWEKGLVQVITAVRDIFPGEEITISYINPLQSRHARQKHLRTVWGFDCSCELCSRSLTKVRRTGESDRRVKLIKKVRRLLREEGKDGESSKVQGNGEWERTKMAELLVSLYKMEGLWGMVHETYAVAAREYNKAGEAWMAMKWAGLAVEFGTMVLGELDEEVREMKELARDPWIVERKHEGYREKVEGEERTEVEGDEKPEGFGVEDESDEDEDEEGW